MYFWKEQSETYGRSQQIYVVTEKAVPDVLLKVVEAKKLLDTQKLDTVQEAVDAVGISRSSFYKYKDDSFPFKEKTKGENITFILQMDDEPGLLSAVLAANCPVSRNILTIHQSIPMNGVAGLTLSVAILPAEGDAAAMVENIEHIKGVHYLKILGRRIGRGEDYDSNCSIRIWNRRFRVVEVLDTNKESIKSGQERRSISSMCWISEIFQEAL